ncbi:efflux RND transporter periplasmic adaptor subunit [Bacteroides sp.]|uniref:efflux RND transporter periplasmic adaptor subunit n=1 Tax=Bacteroides sp. TaxID=29523 RepID=UPI0026057E1E|nr:efflux RND transporter periplasmic adaptor subunit [Bacteroides sp.]MDD3037046.1 efflux RND transporter periplasmic adaptor subunit [Bacteroides sp.]
MKKIIYPLLLLALAACKGNQQPADTDETIAVATTKTDSTAQPEVDAMTSATSKPNQVSFNGRIMLPPQRQATIALTMGGIIKNTSLLPGQRVNQNTVLATLENPEFITLQQTYLDSHAQTEYLQAEYERQKTLSAEQAASQKKFQQSKADYLSMKSRQDAAAAQLLLLGVHPETLIQNGIQPLLEVKSPISGYATNVEMNIGKYINPGEALCEVIDKTNPMLCLTTYEKDLADMQVGSPLQFRVNGMGTKVFYGTVVSIGQKVDEVNRSLEVYATIKETDPEFRPGMYVTAHIQKQPVATK